MLSSKIYDYDLLVDYAIDMSNHETWELLQMWLVIIFAENLNATWHIYNDKSKQSL